MPELFSNGKLKARHFHATIRFINDLGILNEGVYSMVFTKTSISLNYN